MHVFDILRVCILFVASPQWEKGTRFILWCLFIFWSQQYEDELITCFLLMVLVMSAKFPAVNRRSDRLTKRVEVDGRCEP